MNKIPYYKQFAVMVVKTDNANVYINKALGAVGETINELAKERNLDASNLLKRIKKKLKRLH